VSLYAAFAVVLAVWGVITLVRRIAEQEEQGHWRAGAQGRTGAPAYRRTEGQADRRTGGRADDDGIDYDELRRAEEEVRDLDVNARPEDGFEGDDWGPGAPKKPPLF
jgi:hypothetical protein